MLHHLLDHDCFIIQNILILIFFYTNLSVAWFSALDP